MNPSGQPLNARNFNTHPWAAQDLLRFSSGPVLILDHLIGT